MSELEKDTLLQGDDDTVAEAVVTDEKSTEVEAPKLTESPMQEVDPKDFIVFTYKLTKDYGKMLALKGISLNLTRGKIVGLLGPNGSGKTTLIKILSGLLTKTSGGALVDGKEIGIETKAVVSYLPERPYFSSWMRVEDCIKYFEDFYEDFSRETAEKMLLDLEIDKTRKLRTLSKGTKEKVQLVLVMSRKAKLYLLDEPIAGVDPAARDYILDTIISTYNKEATVVISTHLISDIESVLDEYVFIKNGEILEHGNAKEYVENNGQSLDEHFREVFKYVR